MKIINNYDGASIDILINDKEKNVINLSLKKELNNYSNYFNFIVENEDKEGTIFIENINNVKYKSKYNIPLYKTKKGTYEPLSDNKFKIEDNKYKIKIDKNEKIEISSYPRYTQENLNKFINKIKKENIIIEDNIIDKILIGKKENKTIVIIGRQHPGETLSSYFIEGIINYILENKKKLNNTSFLIFPIVNKNGVKNGNHRYYNNNDYNRMWNKNNIISEIDYIKEELKNYNINLFIDVHCDEITKEDYIRTNNKKEDKIGNIKILNDPIKIKKFLRALIKQRTIINLKDETAREYITKTYKCDNMLVELSLSNYNERECEEKGKIFIKEIIDRKI